MNHNSNKHKLLGMVSVIQCVYAYTQLYNDLLATRAPPRARNVEKASPTCRLEWGWVFGGRDASSEDVEHLRGWWVQEHWLNLLYKDSLFVTSQLICWHLLVIHRVFIGWFAYGSKFHSNNCMHDHVFKKITVRIDCWSFCWPSAFFLPISISLCSSINYNPIVESRAVHD